MSWESVGGIAIFVFFAGAGILVLNHGTKHQQASLTASSNESSAAANNQPVTLSQNSQTGPTISDDTSVGTNVNSNSTTPSASTSATVAKLLDPTTFAQYDKYKDAPSAQYIDLQVGNGAAITASSQVAVVYKGWLTNGTLFDATTAGSDGKLQAFSFVEGQHQVIPGWESGLEGAKAGGVRLLIIPPAVGYGAQGSGPVPGNVVLVFQVQIVQVQ